VVAVLFAFTVFTVSKRTPYGRVEDICLTALASSFLIITMVDLISQLIGEPMPDTPVGTTLYLAREKKEETERE